MNILDICILLALLCFGVASFFRGFVREAFAMGGIVVGVLISNIFYRQAGAVLQERIDILYNQIELANAAGYFLLFVITVIVMAVSGRLLSRFFKVIHMKWLDRTLGLGFGLTKGFVIVSVVMMVLGMFLPKDSTLLGQSQFKPIVDYGIHMVPDDLFEQWKNKKNELEQYVKVASESYIKDAAESAKLKASDALRSQK